MRVSVSIENECECEHHFGVRELGGARRRVQSDEGHREQLAVAGHPGAGVAARLELVAVEQSV